MRVDPNQFMELTQKSQSVVDRGGINVSLEHVTTKKVDQLSGHVFSVRDNVYEKPTMDTKEAVQEEMAALAGSAEARQREMAVLSNTMSAEDFQEYRENGGSISEIDSSEIVTVIDKIKIHLAESGADVGRITASADAISSISNGRVTTDQATKILDAADLPATNENVSDFKKAFELASSIEEFSDGAVKYMVDNDLAPEIQNLYYAGSGAGMGFGTKALTPEEAASLEPQIKQVIEESALPVNDETIALGEWMVANEIPLDEENLSKASDLKELTPPFTNEQITRAITTAITEGRRPQEADMLRAVRAERSLEETRLMMTEDANLSLAKKDLAIDTTALQERVEALKEKEQSFYQKLLTDAGGEASPVEIETVRDTVDTLDEIRRMPAAALSIPEADTDTLRGIADAGRALKQQLEFAGEAFEPILPSRVEAAQNRYETMQTEVRRDLGDSIQKAFRNVDDIIADLKLPQTAATERAVRILGYNSMEITAESVEAMKSKDEEVQRALKSLTPAVVARFVKDGENPLDLNVKDLAARSDAVRQSLNGDDSERFSEYLYKLEHNHQISEAERESYIGVFRLLHQVEKSDGAAIGALVNQGADLTMRNLLSAVRSHKKGTMDYTVDDDFGGVQVKKNEHDIIGQIDTAFQQNLARDIAEEFSPEAFRTLMKKDADWEERTPEEFLDGLREADTEAEALDFSRAQMENLAEASTVEEEVFRMMERYELPNTMTNLLALQQMTQYPNLAIRRLFNTKTDDFRDENGNVDFEAVKQSLIEDFGEAISEPEDLAKAEKRLADVAENVMRTMLDSENGASTELDVKSLKMMAARFRAVSRMAEKETYHIPVQVQGETGEMTLKIVSGKEEKGLVDIFFSLSSLGSVAAKFKVEGNKLSGFLAADRKETVDLFSERGEALAGAFAAVGGIREVSVNPVFDERLDLTHFNASTDEENDAMRSEREPEHTNDVSTKTLYQIAKSFLSVLHTF